MNLNIDDLEVLAWMVCGDDEETAIKRINQNHDENEDFVWDLETILEKKYGLTFFQFCDLIEALLPMTPLAESPLTGTKYHAFLDKEGFSVIKVEA
ncbi:MAG: hypothetical protein Q4A74_09515 [Cardiobacteriaceae bacterium]|nr:hypothetical protein [Cardiobacteriaceae bacterium]